MTDQILLKETYFFSWAPTSQLNTEPETILPQYYLISDVRGQAVIDILRKRYQNNSSKALFGGQSYKSTLLTTSAITDVIIIFII